MLSVAIALLVQSSTYTAVPFEATDEAIIATAMVNGKSVRCMYDTGFSGSFILSDNFNVGKPTGTMRLRDFVGEFDAKTVKMTSLKIGAMTIPPEGMEVTQQPTEHMSESYNTHTDGIMGLEAMGGKTFQINFEKKEFRFYPDTFDATKLPVDGKKSFIAKLLPTGHNSLEMQVENAKGGKLTLALDTGNAFFATTHRDVLEELGMWEKNKKASYMTQASVASGAVDSYYLMLQDLKIFGVPVKYSTWSIIDAPSSSAEGNGTVGYQFLKNFNITVDMKHRRVHLEAFRDDVNFYPEGSTGISGGYFDDTKRVTVYRVIPGSPADKAGIKAGDALLSIDGKDLGREGFRDLEKLMHGAKGSKVQVAISRGGNLSRYELVREYLVNGVPDGFVAPAKG